MNKFTNEGFVLFLHGPRDFDDPKCNGKVLSVTAELMEPSEASKEAITTLQECRMNAMRSTKAELPDGISILDEEILKISRDMEKLYLRWADAAGKRRVLQDAWEAQSVTYPECSDNQWVDGKRDEFKLDKHISNHTFYAHIRLQEVTNSSYRGKNAPVWYVSYWVATRFNGREKIFKSVGYKRFTDEESAQKYIAGRIEFLEKKYFYSLDPVIPLENRSDFLVHGLEAPGYTYEKN